MPSINSAWWAHIRRMTFFINNSSGLFVDLERLISRLIIDGYLKQEFLDQPSPTTIAYLRPGTNAVQLTTSHSQRASSNTKKIQIELTIRLEQPETSSNEKQFHSKRKSIEQIQQDCFTEIKSELRKIFQSSNYSNVISEQTIHDLVKLMP